MPTFSDEEEHDILAEYENRSDNDRASLSGEAEIEDDENDESKEAPTQARRIDPATSRKHIVRNPIPKLNTERLTGPKGIQTIERYFEGFKFHGKGHEKTDLDRVMKRLEHWAHRLFPKLDYDDFLARMEALGKKKELQVFIKKYRMDMVTADDSVIQNDADIIDEREEEEVTEPLDEFDLLIAEQIEKQKQVMNEKLNQSESTASQSSEAVFDQLLADTANKNSEPMKENPASQLTDEIRERIERNRQQAIQRRLARLQEMQEAKKKKLEECNPLQGIGESQNTNASQI